MIPYVFSSVICSSSLSLSILIALSTFPISILDQVVIKQYLWSSITNKKTWITNNFEHIGICEK